MGLLFTLEMIAILKVICSDGQVALSMIVCPGSNVWLFRKVCYATRCSGKAIRVSHYTPEIDISALVQHFPTLIEAMNRSYSDKWGHADPGEMKNKQLLAIVISALQSCNAGWRIDGIFLEQTKSECLDSHQER